LIKLEIYPIFKQIARKVVVKDLVSSKSQLRAPKAIPDKVLSVMFPLVNERDNHEGADARVKLSFRFLKKLFTKHKGSKDV